MCDPISLVKQDYRFFTTCARRTADVFDYSLAIYLYCVLCKRLIIRADEIGTEWRRDHRHDMRWNEETRRDLKINDQDFMHKSSNGYGERMEKRWSKTD